MVEEPVTTGLSIGEKLKTLRESKGKSLEELAGEVKLAAVVISQIERGVTTPPVGTLIKLASALGANVGYFFEEEHGTPQVEVVRAGERKRIRRKLTHRQSPLSYAYESLAFRKSNKRMEPFLVEFDIEIEEEVPPLKHEGEEFIFVLEGEVEVRLGGEVILLGEGDSLYFESEVPHSFVGRGHKKPRALAVLSVGGK
jgi:transcriptional regulator with XRE-family HTH domain